MYNILNIFCVKFLVIDLRPYETEVKKIVRGERGRFACDFNSGASEEWYRIIKVDEETGMGSVRILKADRTQSCDNLIESFISKRKYILPGKVKGDNDFISQLCSPMRIDKVAKETGEVKAIYKSDSKKDHFFFAFVYLNLAFNIKKGSSVKLLG